MAPNPNDAHETRIAAFFAHNQWPKPLQIEFLKKLPNHAVRFFICDDSKTMAKQHATDCTRWEEMGATLKYHLKLSRLLKVHTEFHFLTHKEEIVISHTSQEQNDRGQAHLHAVLNKGPAFTPRVSISTGMKKVIERVKGMEQQLREKEQVATIIIFTDGEKIHTDLEKQFEELQKLPVTVVVRLCTENDVVSAYFGEIDSNFDIKVDVIEGLRREAKQVHKYNSWMIYGEPLQRFREFGVFIQEIDLLGERKLTSKELNVIFKLIYGDQVVSPVSIFDVAKLNINIGKVFCTRKKKEKYWVSPTNLAWNYGCMTS